ncbi:MAG: hypothetical protein U5K38_18455 [Woeseiaceae bacterium]|nr:hypothetical protein [Woeseiaceae bacterium]
MQREPLDVLELGAGHAHHASRDNERADELQAELIKNWEYDAAYNIAYVMAYRGDADAAFDWLAKAVRYGDPGLGRHRRRPALSPPAIRCTLAAVPQINRKGTGTK